MHALKVLEYGAILERLAQQCQTPLAAEYAGQLQPSFKADEVWEDLALTAEAFDLIGEDSPPSLSAVKDLKREFIKAAKGGVIGGVELYQCGETLRAMRQMKAFLKPRAAAMPRLWKFAEHMPEAQSVEMEVFNALESDGNVLSSASETLASIRKRKAGMGSRIIEKIQSYVSGRTRDLLSDPLYTVRDGRYVIPLKAENRGKIKGIVHDTSSTGQTVYVEPDDVLQLGNQLRELEAAERAEIGRILASLSAKVGTTMTQAVDGIDKAAWLDFAISKARLGQAMRGVLPKRLAEPGVEIFSGRHPLLDSTTVVPVTVSVGGDHPGLLITGPNTGGKTVAIKTVGLFALMAQSGLLLPAEEVRLGPLSQVWADIGDEQSIQQSLSTFSGHIKNISTALRDMKPGALVLLDEIGAGTDPTEGAALAKSILLEMRKKGALIIASTHYGELKAFAYNNPGFQNAAMEFDAKSLAPTYRLIMGAPGASHALKIAERYGIPKETVDLARSSLTSETQDVTLMLEKLEQAQRQARIAQSEADRRSTELRKAEELARLKIEEAEEIRRRANRNATEAIESTLRELRLEAADIFEQLKSEGVSQKSIDRARTKLKDLQVTGQSLAEDVRPEKFDDDTVRGNVAKGMQVRAEDYSQIGMVIEEPKNGTALVQMGALKMTLPLSKLTAFDKPPPPKITRKVRESTMLDKAANISTELHLRALRAEEAEHELQLFIDEAVLSGISKIRIVHGKGEGILRKVTQDVLKKRKEVTGFRDGEPAEGGQGVTIVNFD
ncbi:MAG: endonuclease MutS2 [Fimbriimonadaceae bacterium]|nr:endonuclease MutS2 [Fimbriimonadaceae bacterium]